MSHTVELLSVGTELLLGNILNTDARDLSRELTALGLNVRYHSVVGDNPERLKAAAAIARERADVIITTGGLGPTCDDLTKQTLAEAFGKKLVFHPECAAQIQAYFARMGRQMTENNLQQAYLPEGCTVLDNAWGTAPGCAFESGGNFVVMLPGPPRECLPMFRERAMPTLAPYAKEGEVELRITAKAATAEEAGALIAPVEREVRALLGRKVYGADVSGLEQVVLEGLKARGLTMGTAESCTGGLIAKRMTDLPGSSAVLKGGIVSYTNEVKANVLGVSRALLDEQGAVCAGVAEQMAEGARRVLGCDLAVSVTGVAGPDSDDRGNPVGLVYAALAAPEGVQVKELHLARAVEGRFWVRTMAANHALDLIRHWLEDHPA